MRISTLGTILVVTAATWQAQAAVSDVTATGFEVVETVEIAATPQAVYSLLVTPARWWSSDHTFSGSAANLTLSPTAGGCWCEALPDGGSVEHMHVVMAVPGKRLVLKGGLGPLVNQAMAGAMEWTLKPSGSGGSGTALTLNYRVAGYMHGGFASLPNGIDSVLAEQAGRLKQEAEKAAR